MKKNNKVAASLSLSISQNYLTSIITVKRIIRQTSITGSDHVIEIGAGKGHITRQLSKVCGLVEAYEIDDKLYQYLQSHLGGIDNIVLKHQDFLKAVLPVNEPYKVFSNIPFSITSKIIYKLTGAKKLPQEVWLVVEKGAAKRFMGKPCETLASLLIKPYFDVEICYYFSRKDFHPMPSVDIVLLHMTQKEVFDISRSERTVFEKFIKNSFKYGIKRQLTKKQISTALKRAGLPDIETSGEILYVQWLCLFRCYYHFYCK